MKSTFLGIGILILVVAGIAFFNMKPKAAIAPQDTSVNQQKTTEEKTTDTSSTNTMGMSPEEHAAMMGESSTGSDVGMEMPIADTPAVSVQNSTQAGVGMDHSTMNNGNGRMIMVSGKNFQFDVKEIRVKKGETVTIHFESADGFHDLVIDEFNVRTEKLKTGGMQMVTFTPNKTGTFEYYCSVGSHRANGMVGKLIVE